MDIRNTLDILRSHDLLEAAEELEVIAERCNCAACKEYRTDQPKTEQY
jgi:hypothetical protein